MKRFLQLTVKGIIIGNLFLMIIGSKLCFGQFSIGAAYYQRKENPQTGFGLRMENDIKLTPGIVRLGVQVHFDYYSEKN